MTKRVDQPGIPGSRALPPAHGQLNSTSRDRIKSPAPYIKKQDHQLVQRLINNRRTKQITTESTSADNNYSDDERQRDSDSLQNVLEDTYSGLANIGEYDPNDINRAIKVLDQQKRKLNQILEKHPQGADIRRRWQNLCSIGKKYLEWSVSCSTEMVPEKYIECRRKQAELSDAAWSALIKAKDANSFAKIFWGRKVKLINRKVQKQEQMLTSLRKSYQDKLQAVRDNEAIARDFHEKCRFFADLVHQSFPSATQSSSIEQAVENWVRNIMLYRSYTASGLTLNDL